MLIFLLVPVVVAVVAAALGFLTGWLSRRYGLPALNVVFAGLALGPALYCGWQNAEALARVAGQLPQVAGALGRLRLELLVLGGLLAGVTLWASARRPFAAAVALGLLYPVASMSASAVGASDVSVAERLNLEFDGRGNFALLLSCGLGVVALLGLGGGDVQARLRAGVTE